MRPSRAWCAPSRRGSPARWYGIARRRPTETLFRNRRPLTSATSMRRSMPSVKASERPDRVAAVDARVQREVVSTCSAGTQTNGRSLATAAAATTASEPSPPGDAERAGPGRERLRGRRRAEGLLRAHRVPTQRRPTRACARDQARRERLLPPPARGLTKSRRWKPSGVGVRTICAATPGAGRDRAGGGPRSDVATAEVSTASTTASPPKSTPTTETKTSATSGDNPTVLPMCGLTT